MANMVIVEGGKVAVRRYTKLLLNRIKWTEEEAKESSSDSESDENPKTQKFKPECILIWEGILVKHNFSKWIVINA